MKTLSAAHRAEVKAIIEEHRVARDANRVDLTFVVGLTPILLSTLYVDYVFIFDVVSTISPDVLATNAAFMAGGGVIGVFAWFALSVNQSRPRFEAGMSLLARLALVVFLLGIGALVSSIFYPGIEGVTDSDALAELAAGFTGAILDKAPPGLLDWFEVHVLPAMGILATLGWGFVFILSVYLGHALVREIVGRLVAISRRPHELELVTRATREAFDADDRADDLDAEIANAAATAVSATEYARWIENTVTSELGPYVDLVTKRRLRAPQTDIDALTATLPLSPEEASIDLAVLEERISNIQANGSYDRLLPTIAAHLSTAREQTAHTKGLPA